MVARGTAQKGSHGKELSRFARSSLPPRVIATGSHLAADCWRGNFHSRDFPYREEPSRNERSN
jgi:hypothetical protein